MIKNIYKKFMRQSRLLAKTKKEISRDVVPGGHRFLVKGDFVEQLTAGVFSFLPLGYRTLKKIEKIIREEMQAIGGQEVLLPGLQPKEIWQESGRWNQMDPPLFKLKDRHEKELALGSTHEEVITKIARERVRSYRDLPLYLYQIQNKFRNEMRSTGGLLRNREFLMKDLYSFHADTEDLNKYFEKVGKSYEKIFKRCGLAAIKSRASGGTIGGKEARTFEFQVKSEIGEDKIIFCEKCQYCANLEVAEKKAGERCPDCQGLLKQENSIELGHIFCLGDKYSKPFGFQYVDAKARSQPVIMGCYGIGIGRLLGTIAEIHRDQNGLCWPEETAPFTAHLIQIEKSEKIEADAKKIEQDLLKSGIEVLYDDREDKTPGEKFADADLLGVPWRIVVSKRTMEKRNAEIKKRDEKKIQLVKIKDLPQFLNRKLKIKKGH